MIDYLQYIPTKVIRYQYLDKRGKKKDGFFLEVDSFLIQRA